MMAIASPSSWLIAPSAWATARLKATRARVSSGKRSMRCIARLPCFPHSHPDEVPPGLLRRVQSGIRALDELVQVVSRRVRAEADRDGDLQRLVADLDRLPAHRDAQPLGHGAGLVDVGLGKHDQELLAAVTSEE